MTFSQWVSQSVSQLARRSDSQKETKWNVNAYCLTSEYNRRLGNSCYFISFHLNLIYYFNEMKSNEIRKTNEEELELNEM